MSATIHPCEEQLRPQTARVRAVDLTGPVGRLEALLNEGASDAPCTALVCHPHPLGGGTMHNKVVYHSMKVLNDAAWGFCWPVLRFNFRGTGLSAGEHDGDAGVGDVLAALEWLHEEFNKPVVIAGFSFGAAMALRACCGKNDLLASVHSVAALGLPLQAIGRSYEYPFLADCSISKLFLSGDRDQFADADALAKVAGTASNTRLRWIAGADHFFTGRLDAMQAELAAWLKE